MTTRKNHIMDGEDPFLIKGVSHSGLEYLDVDLSAMIPETIQFDLDLMMAWKFNAVRLPLRDAHWITSSHYRDKVDYWIQSILDKEMIVILDLHTQQLHPRQDNFLLRSPGSDGLTFWSDIVRTYGNISTIFFEIFNEPHDITPDILWYGNDLYYGYKDLLIEIRNHSQNICILGGLDWAYQWSFLRSRSDLLEELQSFDNIMLSTHPYGYRGAPSPLDATQTIGIPINITLPASKELYTGDCSLGYTLPLINPDDAWRQSFGFLQEEQILPVIATEWGLDRPDTSIMGGWYNTELLRYMNSINMSYVAWAWVRERLDYPSLLDGDFLPTGEALSMQTGPACSGPGNHFYPGPGALVKHDLDHSYWHRMLSSSLPPPSQDDWRMMIFLFPALILFFYLLFLFFTPFSSSSPPYHVFLYPEQFIPSASSTSNTLRFRNRSDSTLVVSIDHASDLKK